MKFYKKTSIFKHTDFKHTDFNKKHIKNKNHQQLYKTSKNHQKPSKTSKKSKNIFKLLEIEQESSRRDPQFGQIKRGGP